MKKVMQQRCHALCGAIAFAFGTIMGLGMHD
jgi:hypothetical protein